MEDKTGMDPRIETLSERKLVGKRMRMSLSDNKTGRWRSSASVEPMDFRNNINRANEEEEGQ